jgi:hypothetical protein
VDEASSFAESVASILDELASIEDAPIRATERSPCPGSECGSIFDTLGSKAMALVAICIILAVAGISAIRARMRRPDADPRAADGRPG